MVILVGKVVTVAARTIIIIIIIIGIVAGISTRIGNIVAVVGRGDAGIVHR